MLVISCVCGKYPAAIGRIQCCATRSRSSLSLMILRHISLLSQPNWPTTVPRLFRRIWRLTHWPSMNLNIEAGWRGESVSRQGQHSQQDVSLGVFSELQLGSLQLVQGTEKCSSSLLCCSLVCEFGPVPLVVYCCWDFWWNEFDPTHYA